MGKKINMPQLWIESKLLVKSLIYCHWKRIHAKYNLIFKEVLKILFTSLLLEIDRNTQKSIASHYGLLTN